MQSRPACVPNSLALAFVAPGFPSALARRYDDKALEESGARELPYVLDCPSSYKVRLRYDQGYGRRRSRFSVDISQIDLCDGCPPCRLLHNAHCLGQDLLALLTEHATSADDINTILDRIHKNHRCVSGCPYFDSWVVHNGATLWTAIKTYPVLSF